MELGRQGLRGGERDGWAVPEKGGHRALGGVELWAERWVRMVLGAAPWPGGDCLWAASQ